MSEQMGGAHSVQVPYFFQLGHGNIQRTQMVSSVDLFGLIAGMAQPTYTTGSNPIPTWQSNYPWLGSRVDMLACMQHESYQSPRTITVNGVAEPYVLHTYNEYFKCAPFPTAWASTDPCHVVCQAYLTPPTVTAVSNATGGTTITHSAQPQTIMVTASGVQEGPTIFITVPGEQNPQTFIIDDDVSSPFSISLTLPTSSPNYSVSIQNPSGVQSQAFVFSVN